MKKVIRLLVGVVLVGFVISLASPKLSSAGNLPGWQGTPVQKQTRPLVRRDGPATRQRRTHVVRYRTWEALWNAAWAMGSRIYPVRAAATVRSEPLCAGDLGGQINAIVMGTARSINSGKYGDAARSLAGFQDKLMCLDVKSMRTLEVMMAAFMANAQFLPMQQKEQAVKGMLNMTLLVLDQIQYTGRSYTLPVLYQMRGEVNRALAGYSGEELGLWFFNYGSGSMERSTFGPRNTRFKNGLMSMIADPARFAGGECTIIEMAAQGFSCGGVPGLGSGGGGGGGGGMPASSGGALGCITAAAVAGGMHGQLQCMARAGGTGGFNADKGHPGLQMKGVLDAFCGGRTGEEPDGGLPEYSPPGHEHASKAGEGILDAILSLLGLDSSSSPDAGSKLSKDQIDELKKFPSVKPPSKLPDFDEKPDGGRGMSADSSGCGASTNAVARANRLFNCTGLGGGRPGAGGSTGPLTGQNAPGTRSMPAPGSYGGSAGGGMSGLMSCAVQGGSLVRTSMSDDRCSQSMCAPGQSCACNSGGSATPEMQEQVLRSIFSPNRPNIGAKDPQPDDTVGGGPAWGGGRGPTTNPFGGKGPRGGK